MRDAIRTITFNTATNAAETGTYYPTGGPPVECTAVCIPNPNGELGDVVQFEFEELEVLLYDDGTGGVLSCQKGDAFCREGEPRALAFGVERADRTELGPWRLLCRRFRDLSIGKQEAR